MKRLNSLSNHVKLFLLHNIDFNQRKFFIIPKTEYN